MTVKADSPSGSAPDEETTDVHDEAGTSTAAGEDVAPDSSTGGSEEESYLSEEQAHQEGLQDAARKAVSGEADDSTTEEQSDADSQTDKSGEDEQAKSDEDKSDSEGSESEEKDDGSDVPEGQRVPYNRFRKVIGERDEVRQEREQYRQRAEQWDQVQTFMQQNELSDQEVAGAFRTLALMKSDPAQAREQLQSYMQQLDQQLGEILPEDLQSDLDNGLISEDRAKELAKQRNDSQRERQRREQTEQQHRQERERRERDEAIQAQRQAIDQWEENIRTNDPDYPRIQEWVIKELRLQAQDNPPRSKEDAVKLAQSAYDTVRQSLRSLRGNRPEIKPNSATARSGSTSTAAPEPGDIFEAARQAVKSG